MNVIIRGSILYAGECYYNLTENDFRRIEQIEEKLRVVLQEREITSLNYFAVFRQHAASIYGFVRQFVRFVSLSKKNCVSVRWVTL